MSRITTHRTIMTFLPGSFGLGSDPEMNQGGKPKFERQKRSLVAALLFLALNVIQATAHASEPETPVPPPKTNKKLLIVDCATYLVKAFARNFRPLTRLPESKPLGSHLYPLTKDNHLALSEAATLAVNRFIEAFESRLGELEYRLNDPEYWKVPSHLIEYAFWPENYFRFQMRFASIAAWNPKGFLPQDLKLRKAYSRFISLVLAYEAKVKAVEPRATNTLKEIRRLILDRLVYNDKTEGDGTRLQGSDSPSFSFENAFDGLSQSIQTSKLIAQMKIEHLPTKIAEMKGIKKAEKATTEVVALTSATGFGSKQEEPKPDDPRGDILKLIEELLKKYSTPDSEISKLYFDVKELVVPSEPDDGSMLPIVNQGIKEYIIKQVSSDALLASDALSFYSGLHLLENNKVLANSPHEVEEINDPKSIVDVWNLATTITHKDPLRALRMLAIYGHDDLVHELFGAVAPDKLPHPVWPHFLDAFSPDMGSILYDNGALDGLDTSTELRKRLNQEGRFGDGGDYLRSGNYHFFGGAYVATELIRKGHWQGLGVNLPVFVSELLGVIYKRITLEMSYLAPKALYLFQAGYPRHEVQCLDYWTPEECSSAKHQVRLNLLFLEQTHEQHLKGAQFAFDTLRQALLAQ